MDKHSPLKQFDHLVKLANCAADAIAQTSPNTYINLCLVAKLLQIAILISLFSFVINTLCIPTSFTNYPKYKPRTQEKLAKFGYRPNMK
jgi:hypothetical protein